MENFYIKSHSEVLTASTFLSQAIYHTLRQSLAYQRLIACITVILRVKKNIVMHSLNEYVSRNSKRELDCAEKPFVSVKVSLL